MDESTWITVSFAGLLLGVIIILAGVFLRSVIPVVSAGAVIMMVSVMLTVVPLLGDDHEGGEPAESH